MEATLAASNARAAAIDAREICRRERRRADAARLRAACATAAEIADAPPAPLAGASRFAARVLGLVVRAVQLGRAGAAMSAREIGRVLAAQDGRARGYTERWVFRALGELREVGALRVTHDYVPVAETKLSGHLLASYGYENSQVANLYRLGHAARQWNPRVSCGQLRGQLLEASQFIANCSEQYSDSGVVSEIESDPLAAEPCEIVDKRGLEQLPAAERRAGAASIGAEVVPEAEASEGGRAKPAPAATGSVWRAFLERWSRWF